MPRMLQDDSVLFEENSGVRKVILNRPKKLNTINYEMIAQMLKKFKHYEADPTVKLVILKGNGRAFCVGGDVTALINFITSGHWSFAGIYYRKLQILNYLLATYKKPFISVINGMVMGGGAGLSMHARFRIATENTVFAMPEVSIGLFPDAGASHFLSRLPGFFGEYLGLTGARLNGTEMLACGLATHFILSKDLVLLDNALHALDSSVSDVSTISEMINKFVQEVSIKQDSTYTRLEIINECFSKETVEDILVSLENFAAKEGAEKWIIQAINSMKSASPTSLKVFLRSIREGRMQSLEQCLIREFNGFCNVMRRTVNDDFFEGTKAMLVDKGRKPQWNPPKLELVDEKMVTQCLSNIDDDDWEPLQLHARASMSLSFKPKL